MNFDFFLHHTKTDRDPILLDYSMWSFREDGRKVNTTPLKVVTPDPKEMLKLLGKLKYPASPVL